MQKHYRQISTILTEWASTWQMSFIAKKCYVMRIHRGRNSCLYNHTTKNKWVEESSPRHQCHHWHQLLQSGGGVLSYHHKNVYNAFRMHQTFYHVASGTNRILAAPVTKDTATLGEILWTVQYSDRHRCRRKFGYVTLNIQKTHQCWLILRCITITFHHYISFIVTQNMTQMLFFRLRLAQILYNV